MKSNKKTIRRFIYWVACVVMLVAASIAPKAFAEGSAVGFTMSPLSQKLILNPGDTYKGTFRISVPSDQEKPFSYVVDVLPYFIDEQYKSIFEDVNNYSLMKDWITVDSSKTGVIEPNHSVEISFTITVPNDAPAGGQYAAISVGTNSDEESGNNLAVGIQEKIAQAYTIFAEITGNTVKQGEILNANVPGLLLSGKIYGSAEVKNTGNVHGTAKYTLQVYPLFSDEEVYSNEEKDQDKKNIMPDRTYLNVTSWDGTPLFGIYNVVYTVEFEGVTNQIKKMVIVCPIWLLFIIIFAISAIIITLVSRSKARKKQKVTEN